MVQLLTILAETSLLFVLLNLVPLPPLAAGHVLTAVAPSLAAMLWRRAMWIGLGLAVLLVVTQGSMLRPALGILRDVLTPLGLGPP